MVKNHLSLENTGSEPIIFKVKTTAPKLYCVRPNVGRVEPHSKVQVEGKNTCRRCTRFRLLLLSNESYIVYLQAFKEEPPLEKPCKDKFLILSATVDAADAMADLHATVRPILVVKGHGRAGSNPYPHLFTVESH